jgi:NAD(P)H dehydrogenase (quinone)
MNVFIIYAHAEPKSFNGALFRTACDTLAHAGHQVVTSDLNAMGFNPVSDRRNFTTVKNADALQQQIEEMHASETGGFAPDIETEVAKIEACDLMIWQFPIWWFGLPGILKGWVDRVFVYGRVYAHGQMYDKGKFRGKRAMLSLTTGGPSANYQKDGFTGDIEAILRPIQRGMLYFIGFDVLAPNIVFSPGRIEADDREAALALYADRLRGIENEQPIDTGRY